MRNFLNKRGNTTNLYEVREVEIKLGGSEEPYFV